MALMDIEAGFWGIRRQIKALIGSRLTNFVLQQAGANGGASFALSFGKAKDIEDQGRLFENCLHAYQLAGFGKFMIKESHWPIGRVIIQAQNTFESWMMVQHDERVAEPLCAYTAGVLVGFINVISDRSDVVCVEHHCQALGDDICEFELLPASESGEHSVITFTPDPGLGRQLNLLDTLFERMPMGIAILDHEYCIQRYNPTWMGFTERYAPPSSAQLVPGVNYFDILPGTEPTVLPLFNRALDGETVRENSVRLESNGVITYWDVVIAPLLENDEVAGILNVAVDVTEREESRLNLEQRVTERTRELQMLLDVTETASSSLNFDEMLITTLDLLVDLVDASRAGVILRDEVSGELHSHLLRPEREIVEADLEMMVEACEAVLASGEPLYVAPNIELGFLEPGVLLPLKIRNQMLGVLVIIGSEDRYFSDQELALFKSIADQMSVAVENTRLYEKAEQMAVASERSRLARDLHDAVTQTLFSSNLIAEVLPKIWERDPDMGRQKLEELRQLTRGALSEMRTMLMELRPSALAEADMDELFRHLVNAFVGRSRLKVRFEAQGEGTPPVDVKEVFYRVAQESLNNIEKHANAKEVDIQLKRNEERCELFIRDDGRGFNRDAVTQDHLGLGIMQERARNIDAVLNIQSAADKGTEVTLIWEPQEK